MAQSNQASEAQELDLLIKNPSSAHDELFKISVPDSIPLQELKERLWEKYPGNPSPDRITIIYAGKVLKNDQAPLSSFLTSTDGSSQFVLHIVVKPIARPVVSPPHHQRTISPVASPGPAQHPAPLSQNIAAAAAAAATHGAPASTAQGASNAAAAAAVPSERPVAQPQPPATAVGVSNSGVSSSTSGQPVPTAGPSGTSREAVGPEDDQSSDEDDAPEYPFYPAGGWSGFPPPPPPPPPPALNVPRGPSVFPPAMMGPHAPGAFLFMDATTAVSVFHAAYNTALQEIKRATTSSTAGAGQASSTCADTAAAGAGGVGPHSGPSAGAQEAPASSEQPQPQQQTGGDSQLPPQQQYLPPGMLPYPYPGMYPGYGYPGYYPYPMMQYPQPFAMQWPQHMPPGAAHLRQRRPNTVTAQLTTAQLVDVLQAARERQGQLPPVLEEMFHRLEGERGGPAGRPRRRQFWARRQGGAPLQRDGNRPVRQFHFNVNINVRAMLQLMFLMFILYQHCSLRRFLTLMALGLGLYLTTIERVRRYLLAITGFEVPGAQNPAPAARLAPPPPPAAGNEGAQQQALAENGGQEQAARQPQEGQQGLEAPLLQPEQQRQPQHGEQAPPGAIQGFIREVQAFVLGFLTSLLPGWNVDPQDQAAFAAAQDMFANQQDQPAGPL